MMISYNVKEKLRLEVVQADITKMKVDAVVNAANSTLRGGGGVDGAIHRAAGIEMHEECLAIIAEKGGCPTGGAVITNAGKMPAKKIIHAVGPVYHDGKRNESSFLANVYKRCMEIAVENGLKTIAFPNISTGVYGFPKKEAAEIVLKTVNSFLRSCDSIEKVFFVCYEKDNFDIYQKMLV